MISISKGANPNYLCKIVEVKHLRKHTNADKLLVLTIDGNDVITSDQTQEGQVSIYFPLECQIAREYLSANNEYRNKDLNVDKEHNGGFFDDRGRVKAVKLRGQKSEGFIVPISSLQPIIGEKYLELACHIGQEFDTIEGLLLVKKYVVKVTKEQTQGAQQSKKKVESKLIDNQFRLHYDTSQLGKNLHKIQPDDIISITWKLHGTSFVSSQILCKRELKWYERAAKWLGLRIVDTEYSNIFSSRKVIKGAKLGEDEGGYYGYDLWADINKLFKDQLLSGETVYGECVGFLPTGKAIQGSYDYGCRPNEFDVYVYRITYTNVDGKVIDLPFNMVEERCVQLGVKSVPIIYKGKAIDFLSTDKFFEPEKLINPDLNKRPRPIQTITMTVEEWQEQLLNLLKVKYVHDQNSIFCKNKVAEEGIVVRVEGLKPEALKLKSFKFLEGESKELDKGEVNIEDSGSTEEI